MMLSYKELRTKAEKQKNKDLSKRIVSCYFYIVNQTSQVCKYLILTQIFEIIRKFNRKFLSCLCVRLVLSACIHVWFGQGKINLWKIHGQLSANSR